LSISRPRWNAPRIGKHDTHRESDNEVTEPGKMPDTSSNNPNAPLATGEIQPAPPLSLDDATVIRKTDVSAAPPHAQWSQLLRGHELGPFVIEDTLGVGGMAAVLRARDVQLDRLVALKILPPDLARDPENVRRFHQEARAAARLDHPHIARVYSSGTERNLHYIAFEYVEGETLRARIERERQLPPADVAMIGWQIAQGLAHACERGVVHRDIKPANIILGPNGQAKLVDMGLARAQVEANQAELTHSGVTLGTFDYLAPEQALDPRRADVRSDIYALGCTLYHALTGVPPVPAGTAARKLQAHQHELPVDPRELNPAVSDAFAAVLAKMMAKNPADRFAHPSDLAAALQGLLAVAATSGTPPPLDPKLAANLTPSSLTAAASEQGWSLLALAVLLLAVAFVVAPWLPGSGPQPRPKPEIPSLALLTPPGPTVAATATTAETPRPTAPAAVPPNVPVVQQVATGIDLRSLLEQPRLQGVVTLTGDSYDLNLGDAGPLVLQQPDLVLQAASGKRPVLRLALRSTAWRNNQDGRLLPGLTVRRGRVQLRGLRLEIVAPNDAPDWTALHVWGGVLTLTECDVVMLPTQRLTVTDGWLTLVQSTADLQTPLPLPAVVEVQRCLFFGGAEAFLLEEGSRLNVRDSVIGPFERTIRTRSSERGLAGGAVTVDLAQVTWLLGRGSGFAVEGRAPVRWRLSESVVAGPPPDAEAPGPSLLLLGTDQMRQVEWRSQANCFHRVDAFVSVGQNEERPRPLAIQLHELPSVSATFQDEQSVQTSSNPFVNEQAWEQFSRLEATAALEAVKVNPRLTAVRLGGRDLRGARQPLGEALYARIEAAVPETTPPTSEGRELVVDGLGQSPGTFATLAGAVASVDPNAEAVIILRQSGQVASRPIDVGNRRLVIRGPAFGHVELNAVSPAGSGDSEVNLFVIAGGSLTLENLALRSLQRGRDDVRRPALIQMQGVGRCRLKSCQLTLPGEGPSPPAAIKLSDPSAGSSDSSSMPRAELLAIELESCFIRGQGVVIEAATARGFQLEVRQSAIALRGAFCRLEGGRDLTALLLDPVLATFDQATIIATEGLFVLSSRQPTPPLRVLAAHQSFFAAADGAALITVGGLASETDLRRRVSWQGKRNLYCAGGPLLSWSSSTDLSPPRVYDADSWAELWQRADEDARFLRGIRFAGRLDVLTRFQGLLPRDLRLVAPAPLDADLLGRGADLDRVYRQEGPLTTDTGP
jgi:serine/threonine protein kinase